MAGSAPVPVLVGPTASGKTGFALHLAEALDAEIIGVDSRQVYRGLEIGSAAPTAEERARVPHHLVGIRDPADVMSAGEFGRLAQDVVKAVRIRGKTPFLVGGSGLYLRGALGGIDDDLPRDDAVREEIGRRAATEGIEALHRELMRLDPTTAARVSPRDGSRITRALELIALTGEPASVLRKKGRSTTVPARIVVLDRSRQELESRIRERVARMIESGLENEVRSLLAGGIRRDTPAMKSVGYTETLALFAGTLRREDWPETIVVNTRRYAKRQRTWFRSLENAEWITVAAGDAAGEVTARLLKGLESQGLKP